jgi:hypothetical protein
VSASRVVDDEGRTTWSSSDTLDPEELRQAVLQQLVLDGEVDPADEAEAERRLHDDVLGQTGWFRWTPGSPLQCGKHRTPLGRASGPGRGAWFGICLVEKFAEGEREEIG